VWRASLDDEGGMVRSEVGSKGRWGEARSECHVVRRSPFAYPHLMRRPIACSPSDIPTLGWFPFHSLQGTIRKEFENFSQHSDLANLYTKKVAKELGDSEERMTDYSPSNCHRIQGQRIG